MKVNQKSNFLKKNNNNFSYYIDIWLERKQVLVKESTFARYVGLINTHIRPDLGHLDINDINDDIIADFVLKKLKNGNLVNSKSLSYKAVKDLLILLNQILKSNNIKLNMPTIRNDKKDIVILNELERNKLEQYIINNINNITTGILLSLFCGLRIGEVCALKWENIDLENNLIHIAGTMARIKDLENNKTKIVLDSPKTINSKRVIPIPQSIIPLIKQVKGPSKSFVLTSTNHCIEPRTYYSKYKKILAKLGMSEYNYHILRHTFATRCIELGFDPKTLSEILGHANVKTTLTLYVHPSIDLKIANMNKLMLEL